MCGKLLGSIAPEFLDDRGIGLPKTTGHATACRFEFGVYALGAGYRAKKKSSWRIGALPKRLHESIFQLVNQDVSIRFNF